MHQREVKGFFIGRQNEIPAKHYISTFHDWKKAFRSILELPYVEEKKLLIIDEFPYMCHGNDGIFRTDIQSLSNRVFMDTVE